jgi:septal ring factor EnvC (AmiA/AmiB activator)
MDKASETIRALKPVTFRYKKEIEPNGAIMFGLIAEEVENVDPDLVTYDAKGKAETVRYEAVNAMLLNEFLKEHCRVQELASAVAKQEATIAQQQKEFQSAITQQQKDLQSTIAQQRKDFEATAAQQQKQIRVLTAALTEQAAKIREVGAQLELSRPAPQTVLNNH